MIEQIARINERRKYEAEIDFSSKRLRDEYETLQKQSERIRKQLKDKRVELEQTEKQRTDVILTLSDPTPDLKQEYIDTYNTKRYKLREETDDASMIIEKERNDIEQKLSETQAQKVEVVQSVTELEDQINKLTQRANELKEFIAQLEGKLIEILYFC